MFGTELRRLREAANLSRDELSRLTVSTGDLGISSATIEALETKLERRPDDRTVLLLGRALERYDQQLAGFALAEARRLLDEHAVGHEHAMANLKRVRDGLKEPADTGDLTVPSAAVQKLAGHARKRQEGAQSGSRREPGARGGSAG